MHWALALAGCPASSALHWALALPRARRGAPPTRRASARGLALLLALLLAGCGEAPVFRDTQGRGYSGDDLAGRWLIINYWATWCAPCLVETPELNALASGHAQRVQVFGVNYDDPQREEAARQVAKMGIAFPVLSEPPHARYGAPRPTVLPTTLLITPEGKLASTLVGPQTQATILAAIEKAGASRP